MRSLLGLYTLIASLVALAVARNLGNHHNSTSNKRHAQVARVVRGLDSPRNLLLRGEAAVLGPRDLEKRFEGARFTFYDAGLGACGATNANSDFIVALNALQFDGAGRCFESITITANGKTTTARIADRCEGCPYGGLDFSRGLFNYFASESVGVLTGAWYFGATPATTTTTPAPAPTTPTPTPTTTHTPTPTSYPSPTSTTNVYTSSSSSSRLSSFLTSSSSAVDALYSSSPNATTSSTGGVLEQLNVVFVNFGAIVLVGRHNLD